MNIRLKYVRDDQREYEYRHPDSQEGHGSFPRSVPFLQDNAPDIAEYHVKRHQYAPRKRHHNTAGLKKALPHAQAEELRIPKQSG